MRWFGFGFNAFGQIYGQDKLLEGECFENEQEVKVSSPTELTAQEDISDCRLKTDCQIRASWSRRASLYLNGKSIKNKSLV